MSPESSVVDTLAAHIDAALPQTQCTRCGFPDCHAYAAAVAGGAAKINQCPPGGAEGVARLAAITGRPVLPLNPMNGTEAPRAVARIDEAWCIGCTLCIDVCPTDAIMGRSKRMHTVIAQHCTGCALCLPVCPVDCIVMDDVSGPDTGWAAWSPQQAQQARLRYGFGKARRAVADLPEATLHTEPALSRSGEKASAVAAALARARARRGATGN